AYHRYHGVDIKIARIFNTYGPRMRIKDGRAIPAFISQALQNQPITVFGEGRQTRSFCYVSDLVDGLYRLLTSQQNMPVNLGNPAEMTIEELAESIRRKTGSTSPMVFEPLPVDDPKVRQPDISLARKLLDWSPRVSLDEGLTTTVAYFRRKLGLAES
ncbi:MAG: NAD-dependent epimerase/dehydratase family protein, partial [Thermoplasmata archaeon]